jgi:LPS export ABC transporter protein LptC
MKKTCLIFAVICVIFACKNETKTMDEAVSEEDVSVEIGNDVEILYSDSARVRVKINAPELRNRVDREYPRQEFMKGIRVEFLDENLATTSVLTSKTATREELKKRITARDSVVLLSKNQERLETSELIWNEELELLSTDKFVKITKPGEVIFGYGIDANQDFSHWTIRVPTGRIKSGEIEKEL